VSVVPALVCFWTMRTPSAAPRRAAVRKHATTNGTILTLTHEQFFDEEARDRHQLGWSGALDKLERCVA